MSYSFSSKALALTVGSLGFDSITTKVNTKKVNKKIRNKLLAERVTHGACLMDMWHYKKKMKSCIHFKNRMYMFVCSGALGVGRS